jgi:hypothetical protein
MIQLRLDWSLVKSAIIRGDIIYRLRGKFLVWIILSANVTFRKAVKPFFQRRRNSVSKQEVGKYLHDIN